MADRARQDFVRVRLKPGIGGVSIVAGDFSLKLDAEETAEVTRAEWLELYEHRGVFEIAEAETKADPPARKLDPGKTTKE